MFYIMDSAENYYKLDAEGQLVEAKGKSNAVLFSYEVARERIGNGRKEHFYRIVAAADEPIPEDSDSQEKENGEEANKILQKCGSDYSLLSKTDWLKYLTHFGCLMKKLPDYKATLREGMSETDQKISDLLHYIEFYELDEEKMQEILEELQSARRLRRDIKIELNRIECIQGSIGMNSTVSKAADAVQKILSYENSSYRPRVLEDLFRDSPKETVRKTTCLADMIQSNNNRNSIVENTHTGIDYDYTEVLNAGGDEEMNRDRQATIFDSRKTDWMSYAREQVELFGNIGQHMNNLQIDIENIDLAIEEALQACEDANYNVRQGYMAFKELKNLRNERKEKLEELYQVRAITERFDIDAMQDAYKDIEAEISGKDDKEEVPAVSTLLECNEAFVPEAV